MTCNSWVLTWGSQTCSLPGTPHLCNYFPKKTKFMNVCASLHCLSNTASLCAPCSTCVCLLRVAEWCPVCKPGCSSSLLENPPWPAVTPPRVALGRIVPMETASSCCRDSGWSFAGQHRPSPSCSLAERRAGQSLPCTPRPRPTTGPTAAYHML